MKKMVETVKKMKVQQVKSIDRSSVRYLRSILKTLIADNAWIFERVNIAPKIGSGYLTPQLLTIKVEFKLKDAEEWAPSLPNLWTRASFADWNRRVSGTTLRRFRKTV